MVGADAAAARLREQLGAAGIGADGLVEDRGAADDREGARRHRAQSAGGADRLRARRRRRRRRRARASSRRSRGSAARREGAARVRLPERRRSRDPVIEALLQRAATARASRANPLIVDPKIPHLACYAGATLVTPNHHEAEVGHAPPRPHRRGRAAGGARLPDARAVRGRADHARRARHVAVGAGRRGIDSGGRARGVGRHRRRRHRRRDAVARARRRRDAGRSRRRSPITPPASSSASSARRR